MLQPPPYTTEKNLQSSEELPPVEEDFPGPGTEDEPPATPADRQPYQYTEKETCKIIADIIPFGILALFLDDEKYKLTVKEKEDLAPLWDKVIEKYVPVTLAAYGPEANLALNITMIFIAKSGLIESIKKSVEEPEKLPVPEE